MVARLHLAVVAGVFLLVSCSDWVRCQHVVGEVDGFSASELAAELRRLQAILPEAPRALAATLGSRAATLLRAEGVPPTDRVLLAKTLGPHVSDEERSAAWSAIRAASRGQTLEFAELQGAVDSMAELGADRSQTATLVSHWLQSRDVAEFSLTQLGWLAGYVTAPAVTPNAFRVRWQGLVTAPSDGRYTFSMPPVNASPVQTGSRYVRQSVVVQVGEKTVLSSTSEQWRPASEPIVLAQGQSAPIAIDFAYTNVARDRRLHPAVMALYWTGPGVPEQLVPSSALRPAEGAGGGLMATYASEGADRGSQRSQLDSSLAFVWASGQSIGMERSQGVTELLDHLWQQATSEAELTRLSTNSTTSATHPLLSSPYVMAEMLDRDRQVAWLDLLKQQPSLMTRLRLRSMLDVYAAYRFYAPDLALDAVGNWMQQNRQLESRFAFRFGNENYASYQLLADMVTRQLPAHAQLLRDRYLLTEGGGCCLPAAYALTLVNIGQDDWVAWSRFLDAKSEDSTLSTESRVDWLLARAMAEEVKFSGGNPYQPLNVFTLRGERFLRRALRIADSAALKQRVYHELIARYASERDFDAAVQLIEEAKDVTAAALADWRSEVDRLRQAVKLDQELQVLQREASRRKIYQRYLDRARANADEAAIQQYEQLLDSLD